MNAATRIDIPPSLLSYVVARSMPDFHRSLFPRERGKKKKRKKEKREKKKKESWNFSRPAGRGGKGSIVFQISSTRFVTSWSGNERFPLISFFFSSNRKIGENIEEAFCSIFDDGISMPRIDRRRSKKTIAKHVSVSWRNVRGQSLQRIRIEH